MGVKQSPSNMGKKTHESKMTSKMSKQSYVTKPEKRSGLSHNYSVSSAESQVKKMG